MRAPYQILLFPYIKKGGQYHFALFRREDLDVWQGIAGGGEDDETPLEAVKREAFEEGEILPTSHFMQLSSIASILVKNIHGFEWGNDIAVIPEFSFGVELMDENIKISHEHKRYDWLSFEDAIKKLKWDSNKTALWELNYRLNNKSDIDKNIELIRNLI